MELFPRRRWIVLPEPGARGNLISANKLPFPSLLLKIPAPPTTVASFPPVQHIYLNMYLFLPQWWEAFGLTTSEVGMSREASSTFSSWPVRRWRRWETWRQRLWQLKGTLTEWIDGAWVEHPKTIPNLRSQSRCTGDIFLLSLLYLDYQVVIYD